jgi:hypothetical protein
VFIADINADLRPDIVAVALFADAVMWYQNEGGGNFVPHVIDTDLDLAFGLFVADLDGDTDLDVLATGGQADDLVWYESDCATAVIDSVAAGSRWPADDLIRNAPNPFASQTVISYELPAGTHLTLHIYDVGGHRVRTLIEHWQEAGHHAIVWDRRDERGLIMPSGVYFCRLESGELRMVRKMIVVQ